MSNPLLNNDDMNDYINLISVDLPSKEEVDLFRRIRDDNIIEATSVALLTGTKRSAFSDSYYYIYLRDFDENDKYNISYVSTRFTSLSKDDLADKATTISANRIRRGFSILPTLHFDKCPELFDILVDNLSLDGKTIELGEFGQNICGKGIQAKLDRAYNEGKVKETNETYVFDGVNPFYRSVPKTKFKPKIQNVYEFEGKKYLRWKITNYYDYRWDAIVHRPNQIIEADNKYKVGDTVWIEINPVKYTILRSSKTLVADNCLVGGIQYVNYDKDPKSIDYETSNVKWYIDTYLKCKLLKNVSKLLVDVFKEALKYKEAIEKYKINNPDEKDYYSGYFIPMLSEQFGVEESTVLHRLNLLSLPDEIKNKILGMSDNLFDEEKQDEQEVTEDLNEETTLNEKSREIIALRNEIKRFMRYSLDESNAIEETDRLIDEYNRKVKNYNELDLSLTPGSNDPNSLYTRLVLDLGEILDKLKENSAKVRGYFEMMEILNECKKDEININVDEICGMIKGAKSIISSFLFNSDGKDKLYNELIEILDKHINVCKNGVEEYKRDSSIKTTTIEELKTNFRKEIRTFLLDLRKAVAEQDVVNSILDTVKTTIDHQNEENKDKRIAYFIREIDNTVTRIQLIGNEAEKKELETIKSSLQVDKTQDIHTVISEYIDMLRKAMALELKIKDRLAREKARKDMIININETSTVNKR